MNASRFFELLGTLPDVMMFGDMRDEAVCMRSGIVFRRFREMGMPGHDGAMRWKPFVHLFVGNRELVAEDMTTLWSAMLAARNHSQTLAAAKA